MIWPFSKSETIEKRDATVADEEGVVAALLSGASAGSTALSGAAALRVPAVASAVRVISEAAASLPIRIMERNPADGTETEDTDHRVGLLLRGDVNDWTSGFELIRDLTAAALTRDFGGIAFVNRVGNEVREIIYRENMIMVTYDPATGEPSYQINGSPHRASEVLHVRGPFDKSPLTLAAEAIGTAKVMEEHASNFFKNGAMPGSVILNKKGLGAKGALEMLKGWRNAFSGPSKTGKTAVLWDDADVKQLSLNSVDSQFLELRKFQILEIARAFRVPPSMLFEMDRATWSNMEQAGREFLIYCLEPWLRVLEAALGRALFSKEDRKRFRILLDRDDLTRADLTARATAISSLISTKVLNPNEAREWLDLAPYAGGNEYGNPHINPSAGNSGNNPSENINENNQTQQRALNGRSTTQEPDNEKI